MLRPGGLVLDVGFGDSPVTTKELQDAVRAVEPSLRVIGVERDLARVTPIPGVELQASHFNVLAALGPAVLVRVMNVLRGYREDEVAAIHALLGHAIGDGGLFLEGSTDTEGHVLTAWVVGRRGEELVKEALLLWTDFSRGFSPWLFRDWLPRDLRRNVKPGTPVHALFTEWSAVVEALGPGRTPQQRFVESLDSVAGLQATAWERARGFVRWAPKRLS
ncbi:MAG: methylase [Myxococcota bacterium]